MPNVLITLDHVTYSYPEAARPAVSDVTLAVEEGEFLAVLGRNGSGKSTLSKLMNALFLPTEGTVTALGIDTRDEGRVWDVRQAVGMVFQNPDNQLVATVVEEDVAFGLENIGVPPAEIRPRVAAALEAVDMARFALQAPHMLSGGQKQRVAVAGMLAMRPRVLILDEATAMLDPAGRRDVLATAKRLNREEGITVVWITHFMEEAAQADRLVVMHEGAVALTGAPREVFAQVEAVRALGLDVPPMTALAHDLIGAGVQIPPDTMTYEEMVAALCPSASKA
jgi:energy-coupling factor transport system ATP-binding protein